MTFKMDHAHERLSSAVAALATQRGPLRERVMDVYRDHLAHLTPEEFHGDARREFQVLMETLRKRIDRARLNPGPFADLGYSSLEIAKVQMRERTAQKIAKSIANLYFKVNSELII